MDEQSKKVICFDDESIASLESKFASVLVISSLLQKRNVPLTLATLKHQVQQMCKDKEKGVLELSDMECFVSILPKVCTLKTIQTLEKSETVLHFKSSITPTSIGKLITQFRKKIALYHEKAKQKDDKDKENEKENENDKEKEIGSKNKRKYPFSQDEKDESEIYSEKKRSRKFVVEIPIQKMEEVEASTQNKKQEKLITKEEMKDFKIEDFVKECEKFKFYKKGCIANYYMIPSKSPEFEDLDALLSTTTPTATQIPLQLKNALYQWKRIDTRRLYKHQCKAIASIFQGLHCIIATTTSSGKSLCYCIPALSHIIRTNLSSKVLLLFPTKALAQDQLKSLRELIHLTGR
ncbi:DEAD/DEAH box helicase [Reticulomyxa filosa]|uniref:DEAD/DEAH box helicase n=1 Tax=Reticulomyxa filosa TaxID=46433 RepID=X6NVT1_RETFI|nr:DEAD/DEAH box helicase [Reticulomyxa filosa]|eukprot:ETO30400.1 DEAD/DEAH box helicase [Reticulomyxa filosa]